LESIGGYHAAKLRRYQDLIDEHLSQMHMPAINMLNTKYIISADQNGEPTPYLNPDAMGHAWFVSQIKVVDNANQESDALNQIDLKEVAVIDREFASLAGNLNPGTAPDAQIELTSYTPKSIDYSVKTSQPGTVVFSEIYYPYGWKATIDGQKADYFRADYLLRAMNVPAGEHTINFTFDPDSVHKGDTLAIICIIIMYLSTALAVAFGIWKAVRKKS
ncbi:MAG: YfhO family protein, partial [Bacteroidales bacterium]|nr:YfhO family protein [Bacteroidales bacterium]